VAVKILETDRLVLRRLSLDDAPFILELVNEPSWLQYIGDKGVRTPEDARKYLREGPMAMYQRSGFGLYRVERKDDGEPMGMCGLIKRDTLPDVDIGFAFLPRFWGQGYAREAAAAVLALGKDTLGLKRIVAITNPDNESSIRLLESLGFRFETVLRLSADGAETKLFAHG
jgi:RimJ/RimL family protein N-acetyltransferase